MARAKTWMRRQRLAIGLIAGYALLLGALLPSFAAADPLQAFLAQHLCGPGEASKGDSPTAPAEHQHDCQMCGTGCAMGACAPLASPAAALVSLEPSGAFLESGAYPEPRGGTPLSRYPSDTVSRAPPQAA